MLANHAPASNDSPQGDSDYETILAALMESARGRSFLQEYLRRNRSADTATLLTAIGRIEGLLTSRSLEPGNHLPENSFAAPDVIDVEELDVIAEAIPRSGSTSTDEPDAQAGTMAIEAAPIKIILADEAEIDGFSLEVAEVQASAIEFLGPGSVDAAVPVNKAAPADRTTGGGHDPFADIGALSKEEKIALFT